jgi:DNA-binding protein YbaB
MSDKPLGAGDWYDADLDDLLDGLPDDLPTDLGDDLLDHKFLDGVLLRLHRRQQALPALEDLVADLRGQLGGHAEGRDATGAVRVVLAPDGVPETITVDADWRRLVGAEGFAEAVTEGCQNAALAGLAGGTTPEMDRLVRRADELMAYLSGDGPPPPGMPLAEPRATPVETIGPERPLWTAAAAESILAELDGVGSVDDVVRAAKQGYSGSAGNGRLTITLSAAGTVGCEADPDWVGRQDADELNRALASALNSLQAEREAAEAARAKALSAPTRLLAETLRYVARTDARHP